MNPASPALPRIAPTGKPIALDQLAHYSPWPARLIAGHAPVREKTKEQILREFNREKWAGLLDGVRSLAQPGLDALEALMFSSTQETAFSLDGSFYTASPADINRAYMQLVETRLAACGPAAWGAELGSGAGNVTMHLAARTSLAGAWLAYELAETGREITRAISSAQKLAVTAEYLDFDDGALAPPPSRGALVFSSFALVYCQKPEALLRHLLQCGPKEIVLFEPIYQFFGEASLSGLLARSYFEVNGYATSLLPAIEQLAGEGLLAWECAERNCFGHNPLCPISVLRLRPL